MRLESIRLISGTGQYRPELIFGKRTAPTLITKMNTLKVGILLAALTGLFVLIGNLVGGQSGMIIAFILAVVMNFGTYWFSDKLVLSMTRAQPVSEGEAPELYEMVRRLSQRAEIPVPRLYVVNDPSPNAFATGRNPSHAAVAVNTGLLEILNHAEVEGVIAHELAHIKHRDTLTMTIAATVAGAITMIAHFAQFAAIFGGGGRDEEGNSANPIALLAMALVAPLAATIIQLAISRAREYEADRLGAQLAGTPSGLANALLKLESGNRVVPSHTSEAVAPLYIVNPLSGGGLTRLFMTHPPIAERVQRLRAMSGAELSLA